MEGLWGGCRRRRNQITAPLIFMENQTSQPDEKSAIRRWFDALPILQFVGAGVIGLCATWTTIQLTQNSQAAEIRETRNKVTALEASFDKQKQADEKKFDDLRKTIVTKEVFDERTNTILKQIDLQRSERASDRDYMERVLQNR